MLTDIEVDPLAPTIISCGSGISACVLDLALRLQGSTQCRVYDGSWAEYGKVPEPDWIKTVQI